MKYPVFITFFSIMLFAACSSDYGISEASSELVVEGWIEDGGFPVVILTKTLPVSDRYQNVEEAEDFLVRWAKVSVSDGQDTVVLTGMVDQSYYPPYIYTTSKMRGVAGRRYHLLVEYDDVRASASTTVPAPVAVDSFRVEKEKGSDTLYQLKACFTDPVDQKNYYQFFTRVGTKSLQFVASYLGSIDDAVLNGPTEVPVYRGHQLIGPDYTPYFSVNDSVAVKFAQVDETAFHFWDDYTKSQSLSGNMFLSSSTPIRTNVKGGIGCWYGCGSTTSYLIIRDYVRK